MPKIIKIEHSDCALNCTDKAVSAIAKLLVLFSQ